MWKKKIFYNFFQKKQKQQELKETKLNERKQFKEVWKSIADFYRFEYHIAVISLFISVIFFLGTIATLGYVLYQTIALKESYWLLLPQGLFNLIAMTFMLFSTFNLTYMKKELKINNYNISNEKVTPYIKKKYKSLCTSYIILNWSCLSVYVCGGLVILLSFIVAYFHNLINLQSNNFGNLIIEGNNNVLLIVVWTTAAIILFFMLWQVSSFIINQQRKAKIDHFYQQEIIADEMIQKYKKSANRKGIAIFLTTTIAVSLIVLITWLVLRKLARVHK